MAGVISLPTDIYMSRHQRKQMATVLNAKLDRALFQEMDVDGSGDIDENEFMMYMLENLGLVDINQLRRLKSRFKKLQEDGVLTAYKASVKSGGSDKDDGSDCFGPTQTDDGNDASGPSQPADPNNSCTSLLTRALDTGHDRALDAQSQRTVLSPLS